MDLNKFLEWLNLSPKYLFAISIVTGSLLFGPNPFLEKLGFDLFIADYRKYIGVVFLGVNVLLFAHILGFLYETVNKKWKNKKFLEKRKERLYSLTTDEKNFYRNI